mgnify:CR=1 FL=1
MNPTEFQAAGHRAVDRIAEYLSSLEERRVFPNITPREVERLFDEPLPQEGRRSTPCSRTWSERW